MKRKWLLNPLTLTLLSVLVVPQASAQDGPGVGINRIAGKPVVSFGPLRDIGIQAGLNLETKNSDYATQERTLYFGPNLQFRFGAGLDARLPSPRVA